MEGETGRLVAFSPCCRNSQESCSLKSTDDPLLLFLELLLLSGCFHANSQWKKLCFLRETFLITVELGIRDG